MTSKKGYITLNYKKGWKVVLEEKNHTDCTKPIFDSCDISDHGLEMCKTYCENKHINVIRVCK